VTPALTKGQFTERNASFHIVTASDNLTPFTLHVDTSLQFAFVPSSEISNIVIPTAIYVNPIDFFIVERR
jgi:hypothetical protein